MLFANDEFFAPKENLIKPGRGIFIEDKYTENGKWMDGWETRRKRTEGHDYCILQLAFPGEVFGFDLDTNHFLGNHPPFASVELGNFAKEPEDWLSAEWKEALSKSPLEPGSQNFYPCKLSEKATHLKLNIFPDGGVARFRAYGRALPEPLSKKQKVDLVAVQNGGLAISCSDMFFSNMNNLIMPGRSHNMGDGWETKRRRGPGHDWVILRLGQPGCISQIEVDTNYFKGNFPSHCSLEGCCFEGASLESPPDTQEWEAIMPKVELSAHQQHKIGRAHV